MMKIFISVIYVLISILYGKICGVNNVQQSTFFIGLAILFSTYSLAFWALGKKSQNNG